MRPQIPQEASRLALLLVLAHGEEDFKEHDRIAAEIATHDDAFRAGVNTILTTVTVQLLKAIHPNDWLSSIRLQLLNLDIDPESYSKDTK